jgi:hypothetical protein
MNLKAAMKPKNMISRTPAIRKPRSISAPKRRRLANSHHAAGTPYSGSDYLSMCCSVYSCAFK